MAYVWLSVAAHYGSTDEVTNNISRLTKLFSVEDIEIAVIERDKKIFQIEENLAKKILKDNE